MRRNITITAMVIALALTMFATAASAQNGPSLDEPHDHALLLGADVEFLGAGGGPPYVIHGFDRCVPLAGGNKVPLHAHHERVHFGQAGQALLQAGHLVVPLGILGFDSCAELEAELPFSFPPS